MSHRALRAVVVAYHAPQQLDRCLASLEGVVEVTVVDNSSSAVVEDVARRRGAEYVDSGENLGFGAGVNVALRELAAGEPRDVILVNPDATIDAHDLHLLQEYLHRPGNRRLAAVSPRLLDADGAEQRVAWPFPSPLRAWAEAVGLGRRLPADDTFVVGAVLLLRWEAIVAVGLFDERFFLYCEETDWQRRALKLGWSSSLCADAIASHAGAGTSSDPGRRETLFHAAQEIYLRKWYGTFGWSVYRAAACLGAVGRALLFGGERRAEAARCARLYLKGPRRVASLARD
jgi:GT2 family glycosyltransferase